MNRQRRVLGTAVTALLVSLLLAGCGGGEKENMDMQAAADRADAMLDTTLKAVTPEIRWTHHTWTSGSCTVTRRRKVMTIISEERMGNFLGVIERHWKKNGYRITGVNPDREMPALFARTSDGFQIDLSVGYKGQAVFTVTTPCVEKSDVAEPATVPNGPPYSYGEIPTPNVRSAFWSATTPLGPPAPASS
ncbi:hypothetical protein [Streptomyces termitum]|uniref:hypothetical protein n=1 Tax=Streptomyces termitum TaxID=67368 RepID=UPI0033BE6C41